MYADTDFLLALLKKEDWLKANAERFYREHMATLWTSPAALTELLLLSRRFSLDPEVMLVDVIHLVRIRGGDTNTFLLAATYMKENNLSPLDALHAAFCGTDTIISSDKVYDKIGLNRLPLEKL